MDDIMKKIIGLIAYLLPYALIPLTFKFAGGLFATVAGLANDRSKGLFDRARNKRPEKYGRMRAGDLPGGKLGRGVGTLTSGVAAGPRGWRQGRKGLAGYRREQQLLTGAAAAEASSVIQANKTNDKFHTAYANMGVAQTNKASEEKKLATALAKGDTEGAVRARQSISAWDQAMADARRAPRNRAAQMASAQAWASSGYNLKTGQAGYNELAETMANLTGAETVRDSSGNVIGARGANAGSFAEAMNNAQYSLKNAGRFDLGGINNGAGYSFEKGVDKANGYTAGNAKPDTHIAGGQDLVGATYDGKGEMDVVIGTDASGNEIKQTMQDALAAKIQTLGGSKSDEEYVNKVVAQHGRLLDALPGATGGNKKEIQAQIAAIESAIQAVNAGGTPATPETLERITSIVSGVQQNQRQARRMPPQDELANEA